MTTTSLPRLTHASLTEACKPENNCQVRTLLDQLDAESRAVLEDALGYKARDLPASRIRRWLLAAGCPEEAVPGEEAIHAHRAGRAPCRCRD